MMVVEADESDGSFQYLPSTMCVVTNIDPEHMEYYGNLDGLKQGFSNYISRIPFMGWLCCLGMMKIFKIFYQNLPINQLYCMVLVRIMMQ